MRILFVADVPCDPDSGAAGTEFQTIAALRRSNHEVDEVWAPSLRRRISHANLHYLLELPWEYERAIARHCGRRDYDVIHVNQGHCYVAARRHRRERRQGVFVCRSHGLDDRARSVLRYWRKKLGMRYSWKAFASRTMEWLLDRHDHLAYRDADGLIVSCHDERDYLLRQHRVEAERVASIHQAPPIEFTRTAPRGMSRERLSRLLHVGGGGFWKGTDAIEHAVNALAERHTQWSMTWVCPRREHAEVRARLTASARERTELVDWLPQDRLMAYYDQSGVFLFPSLYEGFGKAFLEAMSRGMIVLGTPTGGMKDIIASGENGFLVPFNDAAAIVDRYLGLLEGRHDCDAISARAARDAREFSWDRVACETVVFYEYLMSKRKM